MVVNLNCGQHEQGYKSITRSGFFLVDQLELDQLPQLDTLLELSVTLL